MFLDVAMAYMVDGIAQHLFQPPPSMPFFILHKLQS